MSNFFDDLEAQIAGAARAQVAGRRAPHRPRLPWLRTSAGAVAMAAGVAVVVAVVVVALTTGHGGGSGPQTPLGPPSARLRLEAMYIRKAAHEARRSGACARHPTQLPAVSQGAPSPALLSALGVLRRPATAADKLPRSLVPGPDARGVYVAYIRRARVTGGVAYYLMPAASVQARPGLSATCAAAIRAALRAELPQIPAPLQAPTLALAARILAADQLRSAGAAAGGICLVIEFAAGGNGGTCGASAAEITQTGMLASFGPLAGVVPDGVATVTIHVPAGNGRRAQTVTASVVGNVFATSIRGANQGTPMPTIVWRSPTGKVIKSVLETPQNAGGGSAYCSAPPTSRSSC